MNPLTQQQLDFITDMMSLDLNIGDAKPHGYKLVFVIEQLTILNELKCKLEDMENNPRDYEQTEIIDYHICEESNGKVVATNNNLKRVLDISKYKRSCVYDLEIKLVNNERDLPKGYDEELIWTSSIDGRIITNNLEMDYWQRDRVGPEDYKYGYVILVMGKFRQENIKDSWEYQTLWAKYKRAKEILKVRIAELPLQ